MLGRGPFTSSAGAAPPSLKPKVPTLRLRRKRDSGKSGRSPRRLLTGRDQADRLRKFNLRFAFHSPKFPDLGLLAGSEVELRPKLRPSDTQEDERKQLLKASRVGQFAKLSVESHPHTPSMIADLETAWPTRRIRNSSTRYSVAVRPRVTPARHTSREAGSSSRSSGPASDGRRLAAGAPNRCYRARYCTQMGELQASCPSVCSTRT
jgi:hypothetical protein